MAGGRGVPVTFFGQKLGIKEVDEGIWPASFMHYDLGYFDLEQKTLQPSTIRSARGCHLCLRYVLLPMCPGWTTDENPNYSYRWFFVDFLFCTALRHNVLEKGDFGKVGILGA
jgi:hypothetical protein